jgi:uncharacterized protein (TIGR03435 family)
VLLVAAATPGSSQEPPARVTAAAFEVASVKPSVVRVSASVTIGPYSVRARTVFLMSLIREAHGAQYYQIVGE